VRDDVKADIAQSVRTFALTQFGGTCMMRAVTGNTLLRELGLDAKLAAGAMLSRWSVAIAKHGRTAGLPLATGRAVEERMARYGSASTRPVLVRATGIRGVAGYRRDQ